MIIYRDEKMDADDIRQEDVNGMSVDIIDVIQEVLRDLGCYDKELHRILENHACDEVGAYLEKLFHYPDFRSHN